MGKEEGYEERVDSPNQNQKIRVFPKTRKTWRIPPFQWKSARSTNGIDCPTRKWFHQAKRKSGDFLRVILYFSEKLTIVPRFHKSLQLKSGT